jgi:hypothetical protein
VPPELNIAAVSNSRIQVQWPAAPLCYKLQRSMLLTTGSWEDVPAASITHNGGVFLHDETIAGRAYFRLIKLTP